ncbi:MAG: hypothetical protein AAFR71_14340 [Pseudomonadota bacterium]
MGKPFFHILAFLVLGTNFAFAQKNADVPPVGVVFAEGTIVPELDPIITGSTGLSAPQTPAPLNIEKCDADCQAEKLGISFDD